MLQTARLALQDDVIGGKLGGEVEVDETFIGGKAHNMHKSVRNKTSGSELYGQNGKAVVIGALECGVVCAFKVASDRKRNTISYSSVSMCRQAQRFTRMSTQVIGRCQKNTASDRQPPCELRCRQPPHQWSRELLESAEAVVGRHLRIG